MQLVFITGKGGVGKSSVTAAFASLLSSKKLKVGVVELGESRMSDFFDLSPIDYEGVSLNRYLSFYNINPLDSFQEYAERNLPKHLPALLQNKWVHSFVDATPGLNEILLLGKINSFFIEKDWDYILVDAPATGHAISLCDAPRIAHAALKTGPLRSNVKQIWDLLQDPKKTHFVLVTQPEASVVQETFELQTHLTKTLQLAVKGVVVNALLDHQKILEESFPPDILKDVPKEMTPIIQVLKNLQIQRQHQQKLLTTLKKEISLPVGEVYWDGSITEETHLKEVVASQLKSWILKNY